jgi:peroxiredoxin
MKYLVCFLLIISLLLSVAQGQDSSAIKKVPRSYIIWDEFEVRDINGKIYPTSVWQSMITSGKYNLQVSPDNTKGLLIALSAEETEKRLSSLPKPAESKFFKTGEKISHFSENDMYGTKLNLKQLLGKVVVLNFWFIACPPCRQEIPQLNELVSDYSPNKDVVFIAIALDPKYELEQFLKNNPYQYHIIDNGRYIAQQYGVTSFPTHAVIDKDGTVLFHTSGLALNTVYWLKKSIEAAANGRRLIP